MKEISQGKFNGATIACSVAPALFLMIVALVAAPATLAQTSTSVSSAFFGATTAVCAYGQTSSNSVTCNASGTPVEYPVWWPSSAVGGSTPALSLGAEARGAQETWNAIENTLSCLQFASDSGTGYWVYDLTATGCSVNEMHVAPAFAWEYTDSYVSAAQASGIDYDFAFYEVPQYAVCFDYTGSFGGTGGIYYGGPSGGANHNAVSCASDPTPVELSACTSAKSDGTGWCPGPEYDPDYDNIIYFGKRVADHYYDFGADAGTGNVAIARYEIWNEPDAGNGGVFWQKASNNVVDWPDLITQTNQLEMKISNEYMNVLGANNSPVFIGPGFASLTDSETSSSMCGSTPNCALSACPTGYGNAAYGFLNTCNGSGVYGKDLVSIGTFHLYPAYEASILSPVDTPACQNIVAGFSHYNSVQCTGNNLITDFTTRLNNFDAFQSVIPSIFMTEGSWMDNLNFYPDTGSAAYSDMRAFAARYSLIMAATISPGSTPVQVNRQYWFSWVGDITDSNTSTNAGHYGTMCADGSTSTLLAPDYPCYDQESSIPGDTFGGYAYGQVQSWLAGGSISSGCIAHTLNSVAGCTDHTGSLWTYTITEPGTGTSAVAAWIWDNTTVTCPGSPTMPGCPALSLGSYNDYRTLKGNTVTVNYPSVSITFGQEPILLEQ